MMLASVPILVSGVFGIAAMSQAVEPGDAVVLGSPEAVLRVKDRTVATGEVHRAFTVGKRSGKWLWLEAEDVAGWIDAAEVLPLDLALSEADRRVESGEATAEARLDRGLLWLDRGRTDLAIADFDEAIRLEPEWPLPVLNRGMAYRAAGRLPEALKDFKRASELAPRDPLAYFDRGLALLDLGALSRAHDAFGLALRVDPNHAGSRFNRATTGLALGFDGASADAEAYLVLAGWYEHRSPFAALIAAIEHRREGRASQANGLLEEAGARLDLQQWPAPILQYLRGRSELDDLLDAADTPPHEAEARAYAGLWLLAIGDAERARSLLSWVVDHGNPTRVPHLLARSALDHIVATGLESELGRDLSQSRNDAERRHKTEGRRPEGRE